MKYLVERSLRNFQFWSGAKSVASRMTTEELDKIEEWIESFGEGEFDETCINDLFWFQDELLLEIIGVSEDDFYKREMFNQ